RLSINPLLRRGAALYVEVFRNTPLLLQLFFWYAALQTLPPVRQSLSFLGAIFLSQRGVQLPALKIEDPYGINLIALAALALLWIAGSMRGFPGMLRYRTLLFAPIGLWLVGILLGLSSIVIEVPQRSGFGYQGGLSITPELLALLIGLVLYT